MLELNHMIVPTHDREATATFYARIFGLVYEGAWGHFSPLKVNDALTLDFATASGFSSYHLAFKVDEAAFGAILSRIEEAGLVYGSGPRASTDGRLNHRGGGRGVYFHDPNGHLLELLTVG